jgi:hypothetical protein
MGNYLNPLSTKLDAAQIIRRAYDEPNNRLRVDALVTATIGTVSVLIDAASGDNISISDGTHTLEINPDGSINVVATDLDIRNLTFLQDKVDVSGSSISVDNFPAVQVIEGRNLSLSGTAAANNTDVIASVNVSGYDTVIIHNTGTFNLSIAAQFSNDNVNWVSVLGQTLTAAGTAPTTNLNTTNTIFKVPVSGRFFRYRTTAYTSGTITGNVYISVNDINDFGSRNNTISGTVTTSGTATITAGNVQVTGTGAALNSTPIAATAVGQYDVATLALTGTWNATLVAEASNDNTNWFIVPTQQINSVSALPQLSITSNGLYKIPLQFNNLRVRVSAYTSGTVSANARISALDSENLNPKQTAEPGVLTNAYNETLSVASGVLTNIASFTATQNTKLKQVDVSGENVATYEVLVNGNVVSKKRTYFGGLLDQSFYFDKGINFSIGQQVVVRVIHNRPTTANFNANLILIEGA